MARHLAPLRWWQRCWWPPVKLVPFSFAISLPQGYVMREFPLTGTKLSLVSTKEKVLISWHVTTEGLKQLDQVMNILEHVAGTFTQPQVSIIDMQFGFIHYRSYIYCVTTAPEIPVCRETTLHGIHGSGEVLWLGLHTCYLVGYAELGLQRETVQPHTGHAQEYQE